MDLEAVAVDHRQDRADGAARKAAIVETPVFPRARPRSAARLCLVGALLAVGRQRRHAAVRRIDDERRLPEAAHTALGEKRRAAFAQARDLLVVAALPLRELFVGLLGARAELLGPLQRNTPHIVARPCAL